jgi:hypothetical protein
MNEIVELGMDAQFHSRWQGFTPYTIFNNGQILEHGMVYVGK